MTLLNDMHEDRDPKDNDTRVAIATLHTEGSGLWSNRPTTVRITELSVPYITEDGEFGELWVHFNTDDWQPDRDGLIYTDPLFLMELDAYLTSIGLQGRDVGYSEQGMQGDNYVSCDVGKEFLDSWKKKYPEAYTRTFNELNSGREEAGEDTARDIYTAGREAFKNGEGEKDNPHPATSTKAAVWSCGWVDQSKEIK